MSYKQLCIELINELQGYKVAHPEHDTELIDRARLVVNNPPEAPGTGVTRPLPGKQAREKRTANKIF